MTDPRKELADIVLGLETMACWLRMISEGRLPEDETFSTIHEVIDGHLPWRMEQLANLQKEHGDTLTVWAHRNIVRNQRGKVG
jgi:hypothetical protein